jgi:hypothetical protein
VRKSFQTVSLRRWVNKGNRKGGPERYALALPLE